MKILPFLQVLTALLLLGFNSLRADDPAGIPDTDFPVDRYQILWTKSPFAVASSAPAAASQAPAAYKLVGVSRFGGVSYASVVDNQGGPGLFLEQNKPAHGLTLISIEQGKVGSTSSAKILNNGQMLVLETDNSLQASSPLPSNPQPFPGNPGGMHPADFNRIPPRFPARRELIRVPSSQITPGSLAPR